MNAATRRQLIAVILIDCLRSLEKHGSELQFKAELRERLGPTGQKELAV